MVHLNLAPVVLVDFELQLHLEAVLLVDEAVGGSFEEVAGPIHARLLQLLGLHLCTTKGAPDELKVKLSLCVIAVLPRLLRLSRRVEHLFLFFQKEVGEEQERNEAIIFSHQMQVAGQPVEKA